MFPLEVHITIGSIGICIRFLLTTPIMLIVMTTVAITVYFVPSIVSVYTFNLLEQITVNFAFKYCRQKVHISLTCPLRMEKVTLNSFLGLWVLFGH